MTPTRPFVSAILIPAVLNGLLTGAVYALVALGLTLIYGVLHIINFAHGALLTAAMFAAFFAHRLLGLDPYIAALILTPLFFAIGYGLQRCVIGPASHGEDRNYPAGDARTGCGDRERFALRLSCRYPHGHSRLCVRRHPIRPRVSRRSTRHGVCRRDRRGSRFVAVHAIERHRQSDSRGGERKARRRARRHRSRLTSTPSPSASVPLVLQSLPAS